MLYDPKKSEVSEGGRNMESEKSQPQVCNYIFLGNKLIT